MMAFFFIFFYLIFCIFLIFNWQSIPLFNSKVSKSDVYVSVLVAARNEEKNIINLLQSIENQSFKKKNFEVIIINDKSNDATLEKIIAYKNNSLLDLKIVQNIEFGKKAAITLGVSLAKFDFILCTDADCQLPVDWLQIYSDFFEINKPKLVFGAVQFKTEKSWLNAILQLEFATLIGTGAATWQLKMPTMCNGANIGFLKSAFVQVDGYQNIDNQPSGDDVFLMLKIYKKFPSDVYFIKSPYTIVSTLAPQSWSEFYQQRLRWASKWGNYTSLKASFIGLLVLANYISILIIILLLFLEILPKSTQMYFALAMAAKFVLEYIFLQKIRLYFNQKVPFFSFMLLYLFYPFYLVYFAVAGRMLKYTWKNIKY